VSRGDRAEAQRIVDAALAEGAAALAVARSSVGLRVSMVRLQLLLDLTSLGEAAFEGQLARADGLVEEALQLDPTSAPALGLASEDATVRARHRATAGAPFAPELDRAMDAASRATALEPASVQVWEQALWASLNAVYLLKNAGQDVNRQLEWGLATAQRVRELSPGPPRSSHEAQLLLLRAELARDRGEPALADATRAVELSDQLVAGGRPVVGRYVKASALVARALSATLSGGDPYPDFQASRQTLRELHERFPEEPRYAEQFIGLLNDWARQALLDGRDDVPVDEAEPLADAMLEASPGDATVRSTVGDLRAFRGLFALRRGERAQGEATYRDGVAMARKLLDSPLAPAVRGELATWAEARAWMTRSGPDVAEAEVRAREYLAVQPGAPDGHRLLGSVLVLRAELASARARGPLLAEALAAVDAAAAAGATGPGFLALRGRVKERLHPGGGADDLAAARRMDPRLVLLQGL
jgi:hypothetical protein